jgi:hypothetical protein
MYSEYIWNIFGCDEYLGLATFKDRYLRVYAVNVYISSCFHRMAERQLNAIMERNSAYFKQVLQTTLNHSHYICNIMTMQ